MSNPDPKQPVMTVHFPKYGHSARRSGDLLGYREPKFVCHVLEVQ